MLPSKTHHRVFGIIITLKPSKDMENQDIDIKLAKSQDILFRFVT